MANINELIEGWGFGKQAAIGTANTSATIWRHTNLNTKPWAKIPVNEDDRAEIGKGHEFPTQLFRSHYNMPTFEISKYASSEFLAWAMSFSVGNVTVSGSGPYTYTIGTSRNGTVFELTGSGFGAPTLFAGTPGTPNCIGVSVSTPAHTYGGLAAAAAALGYPSVSALQSAIAAYCGV